MKKIQKVLEIKPSDKPFKGIAALPNFATNVFEITFFFKML